MTNQQDLMWRLGFHIENRGKIRILVFHDKGCRPATESECLLWDALREAAALLGRVESSELSKEDVEASEEAYREAIIGLEMKPPEWSSLAPMWHALRTFISRKPQLPAGAPEYDRELIAEMLTDERSMPVSSYSREAINEQVSLLRAADNRDAEGVHTAKREDGVPDAAGYYLASFKHKANGSILWWGPDDCGYTPDLEQAGIYTEIKPGYHDSEYTVPVPVSFLNSLRVRRIVDPGDSLNMMFWSAEKLRAAIAAAPQPDSKESR